MLAVKGLYQNGQVTLKERFPIESAEVIVVFPDTEEDTEKAGLSEEKKWELFEEFSGSVGRTIDAKAEKMEVLDKKYESTN